MSRISQQHDIFLPAFSNLLKNTGVCFFIGKDVENLVFDNLLTNGSSAVNGCRQNPIVDWYFGQNPRFGHALF